MDDSGEHISGYTHDVYKVRLDSMGQLIDKQKETSKKKEWIRGMDEWKTHIVFVELGDNSHGAEMALQKQDENECGSCYGATAVRPDGCCNTCDEIREAYANMGWGMGDPDQFSQCVRENWREKIEKQSNEGCNIHGRLSVNKVRGNFHIAPGKSFQQANMHVHDLKTYMQGAPDGHSFDMSHEIHSLTFGDLVTNHWVTSRALTTTVTDPLAGTVKRSDKGIMMIRCIFSFADSRPRY